MKELVVISGKGGTGKTSLLASFASLAGRSVIVDCDVDAPNLHLLLRPKVLHSEPFRGSRKAVIDGRRCVSCEDCAEACRFAAVLRLGNESVHKTVIDDQRCEGCGVCVHVCPRDAIRLIDHVCGTWYCSMTGFGPMYHALLEPGEENSGRLVALLKQRARNQAKADGIPLTLVDGPPGLGCPVISSLSGGDVALVVAEPTMSGVSDLKRTLALTERLRLRTLAVINRYDLNLPLSEEIERMVGERGIPLLGRIPFDETVMRALAQGRLIVEFDSPAAKEIMSIWTKISRGLGPDES